VSYLLDTNVVSEWRKPVPNRGVIEWFETVEPTELFLSVVTVGEIRRSIAKLRARRQHRKAAAIESWLAATKDQFADRLAPITAEVAEEWGNCGARVPVPMADGLIGATARVHGWTVVTRNTKDFQATGARPLNPFTD